MPGRSHALEEPVTLLTPAWTHQQRGEQALLTAGLKSGLGLSKRRTIVLCCTVLHSTGVFPKYK